MNNFPSSTFLPYMPDVVKCERSLHELNLMWRVIEASAKMNCPVEAQTILPSMAATRAGFSQLEDELVSSLAREKVRNVLAELDTKAQYVIEIVVRNLYERTADVGFLATDRELCAFVAGLNDDAEAMRRRLRAYRSKYTVYDEIILLDREGRVLAQIDESSPLQHSDDPLIAATLASDGYVETFRASALRPAKRKALIYSRRVCHPDSGAVVGVLCLCFHFEEEMARIFQTHRDKSERSCMMLLDADNCVIASVDPHWIPLGVRVPVNRERAPRLLMFRGREYLVSTCGSPGYQGYPGPAGWQGQVMIPLEVAFGENASSVLAGLDPRWAEGLLSHARSFCPPLYEIMSAADMIRRVVWNGQVMTAGQGGDLARLKTILEQISETGARSNALFARSIRELFETVLASGLRDTEFVSHLLVDLLDRNLYERADDCRWWALSPALRSLLAGALPERGERMERILQYINSLYTVYTALVVYDSSGAIVASTGSCGTRSIAPATVERVLALRSEQDYYVTPFEASPLYGGAPTYVYHAAIRAPDDEGRVIGGIGIVFDAGREFDAMLRGTLGDKPGMQAYFIERSGLIVASTDPQRPVGSHFALAEDMAAQANGVSTSRIVAHDGQYATLGCTVSHGYREFKVSDGYRADILALVVEPLGEVRKHGAASRDSVAPLRSDAVGGEYATFFIGGMLYAIAAESVSEAITASRLASVSMSAESGQLGMLALDDHEGGNAGRSVWVFDLGWLIAGQRTEIDHNAQVVIVEHGGRKIGLLVSELHSVAKFAPSQFVAHPLAGMGGRSLLGKVIQANEGTVLIQQVDMAGLFALLQPQG